jgi:hypothetical protein
MQKQLKLEDIKNDDTIQSVINNVDKKFLFERELNLLFDWINSHY